MQLDGAQTVRQITSLETALPTSPTSSSAVTSAAQVTTEESSKNARASGPATTGLPQSGHTSSSVDRRSHQHTARVPSPDLNTLASQTVGFAAGKEEVTRGGDGGKVSAGGKLAEKRAINPEEILNMESLLSKQLVEHLVLLLAEVPRL